MLHKLHIRHRLMLITAAAILGLCAVAATALVGMRHQMLEDRKAKVRELTQAAIATVAYHHRLAEQGLLSEDAARQQARDALRDIRFGADDYYFAYAFDGTCLVLGPARKREGTSMLDVADANGFRVVENVIASARSGGEFFSYQWPRAGSKETFPKLSFALPFEPWGWAIGTGVYIDDLDAQFWAAAERLVGASVIVLLVVAVGNLLIGRGISRPLSQLTAAMTRLAGGDDPLAGGDTSVAVPFAQRRDEIGELACAMSTFRETAIENDRLAAAQEEQARSAAEERRRAVTAVANKFETDVGGVVEALTGSATEMHSTSQSMSATAEETSRQAITVAEAADEASANVQTVASAAEELAASITEISRRVDRSKTVARGATEEAERTRATVRELAAAAERIGNIVELINSVAAQTNLLALNATIEAARAGDAGKGFAVVAGEVKSLADQTAKATGQIGGQIDSVRREIDGTVHAIEGIVATIGEINAISAAIADAIEQQNSATADIARSVDAVARRTRDVNVNISGVTEAAGETGSASVLVLQNASRLASQADDMRRFVSRFLDEVRAA